MTNMIRAFILIILFSSLATNLFPTSVGGVTSRMINVDGDIGNQKGATNGTNGASWEVDEATGTSDVAVFAYMTWDDNNLYLGWEGGAANQQHIVWIDTDPQNPINTGSGSTSTFDYGSVEATLPFTANFFANVEDSYNEYRNYSGGTWGTGTTGTLTTSNSNAEDLEVVIPWSVMGGKPSSIYIVTYINDPSGNNDNGFVYGSTGGTPMGDLSGMFSIKDYHSADINSGVTPWGAPNTPLPVTLTHFTATPKSSTVQLDWSTATELNNDGFEVQRSADARSWEKLGWVAGRGTTQERQDYGFVDEAPLPGQSYYRLKQIDYDGQYEYSPTVSVRGRGEALFSVFPNPARERLQVRFDDTPPADASLRLLDARGQTVREWPVDTRGGLSLEGIRPGAYVLQLEGARGELLHAERVVVQ